MLQCVVRKAKVESKQFKVLKNKSAIAKLNTTELSVSGPTDRICGPLSSSHCTNLSLECEKGLRQQQTGGHRLLLSACEGMSQATDRAAVCVSCLGCLLSRMCPLPRGPQSSSSLDTLVAMSLKASCAPHSRLKRTPLLWPGPPGSWHTSASKATRAPAAPCVQDRRKGPATCT